MTESMIRRGVRSAGVRWIASAALSLVVASPASAQISRVTPSAGASNPLFQLPSGVVRGTDTAYDPAHNIYLVVGGQGAVQGMFVGANGASLGSAFTIATGAPPSYFPRVKYSPEANAGNGGFLVTWHEEGGPAGAVGVHDAVVAYPNGVIVGDTLISDFSPAGTNVEHGCAAAYPRPVTAGSWSGRQRCGRCRAASLT